MKHIYRFLVVTLCWLSASLLCAQVDTKGTDFWLTFGRNTGNTSPASINLQIRIVGSDQTATGTIYFTNLGTSVPFSVAAGGVFTYNLTEPQKQAAYNSTTGTTNHSIHITSDNPVTAYALNQTSATTDATNILPGPALGTDYYQISYRTTLYNDAYAVVATENGTQVFHNGTLVNTLNRGQVYYYAFSPDMTGSRITTDKPVAFFAVNQGPNIPNGTSFIDHIFQQLAPVNTWGKNFFVPVSYRERDFVRIMASQNGTNITLTDGTIRNVVGGQTTLTNLNAGDWVELEISLSAMGCFIQADKPIGVCAFLTGGYYNPFPISSDPAQAWVPSIEQTVKSALIAPFVPTGNTMLNRHHAMIITPTATKNNTTVKIGTGPELPLSGGTWYDHPSGYSFYDLRLTGSSSSYLFTNQLGGLIVMGYGTGDAESYYYLASSAMRTLDAAFYVNDIHYQDLASDTVCARPAEFRAEIFGDVSTQPEFLKWYIDDVEEIAAQDQITWSKNLADGTYQIKMVVLMDDNVTTKTVEGTLIASCEIPLEIISICQGDSIFFGGIYHKEPGIYFDTLQTTLGFDSIVAIDLTVNPVYIDLPILETICQGDSIFFGKRFYKLAGIHTDTLQTTFGCDSIVTLNLTVQVCEIISCEIDAGEDIMICNPGTVRLNGVDEANAYRFYEWQPAELVADPTSLITTATVSETTTFTLTGFNDGNTNLIVNGDFSAGNVGFTSDYVFCNTFHCLMPEGVFTITHDAQDTHPNFPTRYDHTQGNASGRFMAVNGSNTPNTVVWQQNVTVVPNTDYVFYTWVANISDTDNGLAEMQFRINGNLLGETFISPTRAEGWGQFYTIWNSGTSTTASISIINQNIGGGGNDFGLDDIYFASISKCTDTVVVTVRESVSYPINATICQGEDYMQYNFNLTNVQRDTIVIDSLLTSFGCDSIVTLNLTVKPIFEQIENETICENELPFTWRDTIFEIGTTTNTFIFNRQTTAGCDSIVTLNLTVNLTPSFTILENTVCQNDSIHIVFTGVVPFELNYTFNGVRQSITISGMSAAFAATQAGENPFILHSLVSANGCSLIGGSSEDGVDINGIVWATRNVDAPGIFAANPEDFGMFYQWNRNVGWSSTDPMINSNGGTTWDSTVPIEIEWESANCPCPPGWRVPTRTEQTNLINASSQWTTVNGVAGRVFGSGDETIFLPAAGDRDRSSGSLNHVGTSGAYWSSRATSSFGNEAFSLYFNSGLCHALISRCASGFSVRCVADTSNNNPEIIIPITVHPIKYNTISATICANDSILFNGNYYRVAGIYTDTLQTAFGCDSIVTLNLTVNPVYQDLPVSRTICQGDSIFFGRKFYKLAGIHADTLRTRFDCDSIVTLNLTVNPVYQDLPVSRTICQGDSIFFGRRFYKSAGIHIDILKTKFNCDSIITLNLTVNPTYRDLPMPTSICRGDSIFFGGQYRKLPGIYYDTLQTRLHCDSIVSIDLSVIFYTTPISVTICPGEFYDFFDTILTDGGTYFHTLPSRNGCDSTIVLTLALGETYVMDPHIAIVCQGTGYQFAGRIYREEGIYTETLKTRLGCDSVVTLNLTVLLVKDTLMFDTIFVNRAYVGNGFRLPVQREVGTFVETRVHLNTNGCEGVARLLLTVQEECEVEPTLFFTPNGDGRNDKWIINNLDCLEGQYIINIYDRFGKKLVSYANRYTPWDGTYLGKPMPSTDYWYIITAPRREVKIGHFTLIRK